MTTAQTIAHLRRIAALARDERGRHGTALVSVWTLDRAADELERLAARVAELDAPPPDPSLFDLTSQEPA